MNLAVYPPCWTVPLNPRRSVHPNRLHGGRTQHPSRCSVQTSHSPGAAGLCKCQFSRRWDGSYWWKHKDLWILPSWARRPGTPEEAWTRPAVAGSSFRDDPLLSWTGAGNRLVNRQRWCCAVWWFFFFFFYKKSRLFRRRTRWQSVVIDTRGGSLHTSSLHVDTHKHAVALSLSHTRTHTSMHREENVPRQWARPLKKLDTARLPIKPVILHDACVNIGFWRNKQGSRSDYCVLCDGLMQ